MAPSHKKEINVLDNEVQEGKPWFLDIKEFIKHKAYLEGADKKDKMAIRMLATQFILYGGPLYKWSFNGVHLKYVDKEEAKKLIEDVHEGIYGPHINGKMLAKKMAWIGFFWTTMETNCMEYVRCHEC